MDKKQILAATMVGLAQRAEELTAELNSIKAEIETKGEASAQQNEAIQRARDELDLIDAEFVAREKKKTDVDNAVKSIDDLGKRVAGYSNSTRHAGGQRITGGDKPGASKDTAGFTSFREYLGAVQTAKVSGSVDPRLRALNAQSTFSREGVGADGGYAVPPQYEQVIERVVAEMPEALENLCDVRNTTSSRLNLPIDAKKPWTGGISVGPIGEGAAQTAQKQALGMLEIPVRKIGAFVGITDELMEDAPAVEQLLTQQVGEAMVYALNEYIINGDGVAVPKGLLKSGSLITQSKKSGQAADTIVAENIVAMWSRLHKSARASAVWLVSADAEAQLPLLTIGNAPIYMPPGGLSGLPYATLLGRPVIQSDECEALGDLGDIVLAGMKSYVLAKRRGATFSNSIHFAFDQDLNMFKVTARYGGQSKWSEALSPKKGAITTSNVVQLEAR